MLRHPRTSKCGITHRSIVTCLGYGRSSHLSALHEGRSGLSNAHGLDLQFDCYLGRVPDVEEIGFPSRVANFDNRATRLALAALVTDGFEQAVLKIRNRWGADRCGIVLGTSTSGVEKLEKTYKAIPENGTMPENYSTQHHDNLHAITAFLQEYLGFTGPSYTISTACSSSAKALVDACQLVESGLCDAVLTGGVDSLCMTSLYGFDSLELMSKVPCRPCDLSRDGLSIGEAAAFMIVERDADGCLRLSGYGESSDGTSMSTPPPDGSGAAQAIKAALVRANLTPNDIGYVNLHGTATIVNDSTEAKAVETAIYRSVPASSVKGAIGHTLGAAGAVEAVLCQFALEDEVIPGNTGLIDLDPALLPNVRASCRNGQLRHVVSNSFGFGGSNCALVLSR